LQVELEITLREKRVILKKLTDYMIAYDRETVELSQIGQNSHSASNRASKSITIFKDRKLKQQKQLHPEQLVQVDFRQKARSALDKHGPSYSESSEEKLTSPKQRDTEQS